MMSKLHIGTKETGGAFTLPADAVTQAIACLGRRGSGKTNTAVVMVEELLKAKNVIVWIDPVGVAWGLRSSRDGKDAGFPVLIMGGEHADVPLQATAGKTVAQFLVADRVPAVLDVGAF